MAKVITFSRTFPAYHPKKGQPTFFVEKLYNSLDVKYWEKLKYLNLDQLNNETETDIVKPFHYSLDMSIKEKKHHTIRSGNRWSAGDYFSPRVWSGRPYNSPMIKLAPDIQIESVYNFSIRLAYKMLPLDYDTDIFINRRMYNEDNEIIKTLAENDGLTKGELFNWFKYPKPFEGQIICWSELVNY